MYFVFCLCSYCNGCTLHSLCVLIVMDVGLLCILGSTMYSVCVLIEKDVLLYSVCILIVMDLLCTLSVFLL